MNLGRRQFIGALAALSLAGRPALVGAAQSVTDLQNQAARAAVALSRFEAMKEYGQLYAEMHLDCQALVPPAAVYGWYRDVFEPRGPGGITDITDVRFVPWTWAGNGKTYPETAEVSFVQPFRFGGPVSDVVRLVRDRGRWRWFFGRNTEFINQQIAIYAPRYPAVAADPATAVVTDDGLPPWGSAAIARPTRSPATVISALPARVALNTIRPEPLTTADIGLPSFSRDVEIMQYFGSDPLIPTAIFALHQLANGVTVSEAITRIKADGAAATPADIVLVDGSGAGMEVPYLLSRWYANDAIGVMPVLWWGAANGRWLFGASAQYLVGLRILVQTTAANLRTVALSRAVGR